MDEKALKRDAARINSKIIIEGSTLVAREDIKIHIPERFTSRKLASIDFKTTTVGVFAIISKDGYYAVSRTPALIPLSPASTTVTVVNEVNYLEFGFDAGSVICPNIEIVQDNTLPYYIFEEIISKGRVPWYLNYEDVCKIFVSSIKYANFFFGNNNSIMELLASEIARDSSNAQIFYRTTVKSMEQASKMKPRMVPMRSVLYGANNTTARLLGAYFDESLTSALVNHSDRLEGVEEILRS